MRVKIILHNLILFFMHTAKVTFAILLSILLLGSCRNKKNELSISSKNFEEEIALQQNLQFTFDKDLYPDSLLQRWDSTAYIVFTPKVQGMFKWNSSSELVFSPADGFKPGTEYTGVLSPNLFNKSKRKFNFGSGKEIKFHTPGLKVVNTHLSWTRSMDMSSVLVQMDLDFNYDISASEAATHLSLKYNGRPVQFNAVAATGTKSVSVQFLPLNDKDEETPLKIELSKGIKVINTTYVSDKDTAFTANIPSRYNLEITGVVAQHNGTEGIITVNTSQPLTETNLKAAVRLDPATPFEISLNEAGFTITGKEIKADKAYTLFIDKQMEGSYGGRLKDNYSEQVHFGELKPEVHFVNTKGVYLSSKGFKNLALSIVNVPEVEVQIIKVYENNLEFFLRKDKRWGYHYDDEDNYGGDYMYYNTEDLGDTIFKKTYKTSQLPGQNAARILHLDFQDKIKDYDGVYVVCVASKDHYWIQDSKILSLSDIGLIVKEDKDNMYVFANSIRNTGALSNVKLSFISTNNQKVYSATTDNDGMAVFKNISKTAPGFRIGLVTARMNEEFSFVWLNQSRVETSRFDVGGRMPNATGLNAMIYAERNLYRQGEILHVSAVVRDEQWNMPGEMPVKFKLLMPNGKEFATMRKTLNEEGSAETSFTVPSSALTGTYTLELYSGNDILLNSYNISIEDFVPDRMKVEVKINQKDYKIGDTVRSTIQADNLFGTPAANRNYQCELNMDKATFTAKDFDDYDFSIRNDFNFSTVLREGQTAERGNATELFGIGPELKDAGFVKGNIMATVFDETGRPVHRYEHFTVYAQPYYIGIKSGLDYVGTKSLVKLPLVATDKNGVAQHNVAAQVTVIKKEWNTVIEKDGDRYRYKSQQDERIVSTQQIKISGTATNFSFVPQLSGEYEIRIALPGTNNYVSQYLYAWGYGNTQYTSFEVNNEGNVSIKADKEKYNSGEKMNLLFTTPFEGKLLVTVERDHIIEHHYLNTKDRSASLDLKTGDEFLPNVYISATLFRAMDGSDMPLTVAHGFKNVFVEDRRNELPVAVKMTEKSRSKTKQTITVKTAPNAYVTIAAVDEGILQVKNYQTPEPYKYFYQKVGLSVNSYDIYPLLLPEIKTTRSSTGGDGAGESNALRVNPKFVNRIKLVSFWSGILQADGNGNVRYDIDVPQFSGDIRVMAFAYKGKAFGSADNHMKVADPVVISAALPRFLSPKDEVLMPVTVSNTTTKDAVANISIKTTGELKVNGNAAEKVSIKANSEARVLFRVAALPAIGEGKLTVVVQALNETFTDETDISIRPAASLQKITGSGIASETKPGIISLTSNFIPATFNGNLVVSKSPLTQFAKNLDDLVRYPYGCVEQTTSAVFPQLYYQDLVKSVSGKDNTDMNPNYNVQQAIIKLQSMQLPNGALSYWPGGGYESWWGSIYATHFLIEAKKAGFDVNENTVNRLLQYMKTRLQKRETEFWYYNDNQKKEIVSREIIYSIYVLALGGQPQLNTMNYYKANTKILSPDSKYLLAAAYSISGQSAMARDVLPKDFGTEKSTTAFGGSFYSYVRDLAISLNSLVDIDPNNAQVGILAKQLSEQMLKERYLNTQQNAFGILALGKIARIANKTTGTASVTSKGKPIGVFVNDNFKANLKNYVNQTLNVTVKGKGNFYYFWEMSGITADGSFKEEDSYMKVRRTFYDRDGKQISTNSFKQNDLVVVKISIIAQYSGDIENVVISDILPAGLEIENTRLSDMPEMKWIKEESEADYVDYRDDRVNLFTTVNNTERSYYYMVRAVSPGSYTMGPVQADAMYNGYYHSYNGGGIVTVMEK